MKWSVENWIVKALAPALMLFGVHSMVLRQDGETPGSIWVTGSNKFGQFGDGTTTSKNNFIELKIPNSGAVNFLVIHA